VAEFPVTGSVHTEPLRAVKVGLAGPALAPGGVVRRNAAERSRALGVSGAAGTNTATCLAGLTLVAASIRGTTRSAHEDGPLAGGAVIEKGPQFSADPVFGDRLAFRIRAAACELVEIRLRVTDPATNEAARLQAPFEGTVTVWGI
jgi:hypothetical protein